MVPSIIAHSSAMRRFAAHPCGPRIVHSREPRRRSPGLRVTTRLTLLMVLTALALAPSASAQGTGEGLVTLQLSNGSILVGRILSEADGKIRFQADMVGEVLIDAVAVTARSAASPNRPPPPVSGSPEVEKGAATRPAPPTPIAPPHPSWVRSLSVGGSYHSAPYVQGPLKGTIGGLTGEALGLPGDQTSAQVGLTLLRNGLRDSFLVIGSFTYAGAQPTGTLMDIISGEAVYTRLLKRRLLVVSDTSVRRDSVRHINNAVLQSFGVGRRLHDTARLRMDVVTGLDLRREDKGTQFDGDLQAGYGVMEQLMATPRPGVVIQQMVKVRTLAWHPDLYAVESALRVTGPLTPKIGLMANLAWNYDRMLGLRGTVVPANGLFPGSPRAILFANRQGDVQLTTGLQFTF
jgi:hypothetical protein